MQNDSKNKPRRLDNTALLFVIVALALTAAFVLSYIYQADVLHRNITFRIEEMLRTHKNAVSSSLAVQSETLSICAQMVAESDGDIASCISAAPKILDELTRADRVALTDLSGHGMLTNGEDIDISTSDIYPLVQNGVEEVICIGRRNADAPLSFLMARTIQRNGEDAMILAASYSIEDICEYLLRSSHDSDGCILMDEDGTILMRTEMETSPSITNVFQSIRAADSRNAHSAMQFETLAASEKSGYVKYTFFGEDWYLAFADLGVNDWKIICRVRAIEFDYMTKLFATIHWSLYALSIASVVGFSLKYTHDIAKRAKKQRLADAQREAASKKA